LQRDQQVEKQSDNLPFLLFERLNYCLAKPLYYVIQTITEQRPKTRECKRALITLTAVFKKGPVDDVSSYQSVLTTCITKQDNGTNYIFYIPSEILF